MSGPARLKRLNRELQECSKDSSVKIEQVDDKVDHFIGSFPGPIGTPYEGGWFSVDVQAPERYPFEPLKMKFITKVYHPNVSSQSGYICLDILKTSWSPVYTLRTCLVSLQSLLSTPEPNDPQDAEVAKHYLSDRDGFEQTAKFWTEVYASRPRPRDPSSSTTTTTVPASRPHSPARQEDHNGEARSKRPRRTTTTAAGSGLGSDDDDDSVEIISPPPQTPNHDERVEAEDESSTIERECRLSGLDQRDVELFSGMGFEPTRVIEVLKRLNWRRGNRDRCSEDQVVLKLID